MIIKIIQIKMIDNKQILKNINNWKFTSANSKKKP